jgi:hypothetical protein
VANEIFFRLSDLRFDTFLEDFHKKSSKRQKVKNGFENIIHKASILIFQNKLRNTFLKLLKISDGSGK